MSDNTDDTDKVIDLDQHRIKLLMEGKPGPPDLDTDPMAYFEVVWGPEVVGWNAVTVDMEAYRQGVPLESLVLRPPETTYEVELIVTHLRTLANDIALQYRLNHLIDPHPDNDSEVTRVGRSVPEDGGEV
jgi:hypothetical protein